MFGTQKGIVENKLKTQNVIKEVLFKAHSI